MIRKIKYWLSVSYLCLLTTLAFSQSETHNFVTYDTSFTLQGSGEPIWILRISRPVNMFTVGNQDTASRPVIFFMPGDGQLGPTNGTVASNLQVYGPHYLMNQGWDGSVVLGNGTHYPIIISVICNQQNVRGIYMRQMIDTIRHRYHIKWSSIGLTGLSKGGISWGRLICYSQTTGDETAMAMIRSYAAVQGNAGAVDGVNPTTGDAQYNPFGHWANKYNGKYLGIMGTNDAQNTWYAAKRISDSLTLNGKPNTAFFTMETLGPGANPPVCTGCHGAWNTMYNPSTVNWLTGSYIGTNGNFPNQVGNYYEPTGIFQWMLRQGDTTLVGGCSPTANAGPNQTIYLPFDATIYPTDNGNCGNTIVSRVLTQISGPNTAVINQFPNQGMPDLSNGVSANQQTRYFQPHSDWLNQSAPVVMNAYKAAGIKTVRIPADPVLTIIPTKFDSLNMLHLPSLDSIVFRNLAAGFNVVIDFCHDLGGGSHIFDSAYTLSSSYRLGIRQWMKAIYKHYSDLGVDPTRLVFEIWNEPKDPGVSNVKVQCYDLQDSIIKDMRSVNSTYWIGVAGTGATVGLGGCNVNLTNAYKLPNYTSYGKIFYIYHGYLPNLLVFQGKQAANDQGTYNLPFPATHATATKVTDSVAANCPGCNGAYNSSGVGTLGELWTYGHTQTWNWDFMDSIIKNAYLFSQAYGGVPMWDGEYMGFQYGNGITTGTLRPVRLNYMDYYNAIHRRYNIPMNAWDPNGVATRIDSNLAITAPIRIDDTLVNRMGYRTPSGALYSSDITITGLTAGTYVFRYTVTDNIGGISFDDITIIVNPTQPPSVSAGINQSITAPDNDAVLPGSASPNGGAFISTLLWTQSSGPSPATITPNNTAVTTVGNLIQGIYVFRLTATDNNGNSNYNETTITVVNAGSIQRSYPFIGLGEYQAFFVDAAGKLWGLSSVMANIGITSGGTKGILNAVPVTPSTLTFLECAGGLHGGAAIDINGRPLIIGDNADGQYGNGTSGAGGTPVFVTIDSAGNAIDVLDHIVFYYVGNADVGLYAWKEGSTTYYQGGGTTCGMQGDGTLGAGITTRWQKMTVPDGKMVKDIKAGYHAILLTTSGDVYTTGGGTVAGAPGNYQNLGYVATNSATDYRYWHKILSDSIAMIAGGTSYDYAYSVNGHLVGWGFFGGYMGAANNGIRYATPTNLDTVLLNKMDGPIKRISTNTNSTHAITTKGTLYGWGDNAQGTIGNGQERDYSVPPLYAWDFGAYEVPVRWPIKITNKSNWKEIWGADPFIFYTYATDSLGNVYACGRNKSAPIANGIMGATSAQEATYANALDVPWMTPVTPFTLSTTYLSTCPYCLIDPSSSPCNQYTIPTNTPPIANAGGTQNISTSTAVLSGSASTDNVHISYYEWKQISGPNTAQIEVNAATVTNVKGLIAGTYVFQLKCVDNGWLSSTSNVTINVSTSQQTPCDCFKSPPIKP